VKLLGRRLHLELKVVRCRNVEVCFIITSCQPVNSYRYFGGAFCVHPSGCSGPLIGITSQKTWIFVITNVKAPNLVLYQMSPLRVLRSVSLSHLLTQCHLSCAAGTNFGLLNRNVSLTSFLPTAKYMGVWLSAWKK